MDFSTSLFKNVAENRHGLRWETEDPPRYVWGSPPPGVIYRPTIAAITFAWRFILDKIAPEWETQSLQTA